MGLEYLDLYLVHFPIRFWREEEEDEDSGSMSGSRQRKMIGQEVLNGHSP